MGYADGSSVKLPHGHPKNMIGLTRSNWDAQFKQIKDLAQGMDDNSAITKGQAENEFLSKVSGGNI